MFLKLVVELGNDVFHVVHKLGLTRKILYLNNELLVTLTERQRDRQRDRQRQTDRQTERKRETERERERERDTHTHTHTN